MAGGAAQMINLLHVIDTGGPGGAETVFMHTTTGLDAQRFRSVSIVGREGWLAESMRKRGASPEIVDPRGSFNTRYLRHILRTARAHRADLIVGHLYGSAVYCSLAGRLLGLPVVSVLHGQSDVPTTGRFALAKRFVVRAGSKRLVLVSDKLRRDLRPLLGGLADDATVIPNGVDVERFSGAGRAPLRTDLGLPADAILVGAVGNIRPAKAYDVLLEAARLLCDRSPRYRFAIAGEGSGTLFSDLQELRRKLKLDQQVSFLGLRSDVAELLRSFDVYALSSTTEGFSIACIEAMAGGTPVVATRSGGPEDILEHERSGLLVPTRDPTALADAIERVAMQPALAGTLVANAKERVSARYTLRAMIESYEKLFTRLVET